MNPIHQKIEESLKKFVEKGASLEHERWAKWQKYLHSKLEYTEKLGKAYYLLPADLFERWEGQIHRPYSELSEEEKESDRKEARTYLPLLKQFQLNLLETIREEIEKLIKNNSDYNKGVQDVLNLLTNNISTTVDETDRCYLVFEEGEMCCTYNHTMGALCLNGRCRYCRNLECVCYQDC